MFRTKWISHNENLDDVNYIRRKVFVEEQNISEADEFDTTDRAGSIYLVVYDGGNAVATGRLNIVDNTASLERIAVLPKYRGKRYGDLIVRMLIRKGFDMGYRNQIISAQVHAIGFYEKLGFKSEGEEYLDAGIPHIKMRRFGDVGGHCGYCSTN